MADASQLLAQTTGNTTTNGFDLGQYNSAPVWDISKIMNFGYSGYKTFVILFTLFALFGIAGLVISLLTSGENSGRQRFAVVGIGLIIAAVGIVYLGPWLMSVISKAAQNASQ